MTGNTSTIRARVDYYDHDKGFGFAITTNGQRVFFHQSGCCVVEGTPEEPILTGKPSTEAPRWSRRCSYPSDIIISKVVSGARGPKAVAWGIVPVRTWLEELEFYGTLDKYEGGRVTIGYSRYDHGRFHRKSEGTLLATPQLTPGDPWSLRLVYDAHEAKTGEYPKAVGRIERTFTLEDARSDKQLPYGRYAMNVCVSLGGRDEWAHIVFYPASESSY